MTSASLDRDRLTKLLGMLGSDHPGEGRRRSPTGGTPPRRGGLTWGEILLPRLPALQRQHHHVETAAEAIDFLLDNEQELTAWEQDFARSLKRQRSPISPKIAVLDQLFERVRRAAARAA